MKSILNIFVNLYPVWIISSSIIGFVYPPAFLWFSAQYMLIALALVMLGMGLTLHINDFRKLIENPLSITMGVLVQYTIMPVMGWGVATVLSLEDSLAVGLILVSCCPGGTASNVIAFLAKANLALSVIMTMVSTILAIAVTPMLTELLAGKYIPVDGWGIFKTTIQVVLIPVIIGVCINCRFPNVANKMKLGGPIIAVVAIVFIAGSIVAQSAEDVQEHALSLFAAATLVHLLGFLIGYYISRFIGFDKVVSKTVSIETGMQNGGLAAVLAKQNFPLNPMVAVPAVFSSVIQTIIGGLLAGYWRLKSDASDSSNQNGSKYRNEIIHE